MKVNSVTYAEELARNLGLSKASEVAEGARKSTAPDNFADLPQSEVFADKSDRGQWTLRSRELRKLHLFWNHVYRILAKKLPRDARREAP
jgi:hypothetical protein